MQIKTSQKRSLLNKLREKTDIGGIATEKYFNPEFQDLMNKLRDEVDDPVRAEISGETIGNSSSDEEISAKELLKSAKSYFHRREYMSAISELSRFHKKFHKVSKLLSDFKINLDKIHEKFLFEGLDQESKKHLLDMKTRGEILTNFIFKKANILDFLTNYFAKREKALAIWEKRYPNRVKKIKDDSVSLLNTAEKLFNISLSSLKEMASARATRNPDSYILLSEKIIKEYQNFDKIFRKFYDDHIKSFLEKQELEKLPIVEEKRGPTGTEIAPITTPTNIYPLPKTLPMEKTTDKGLPGPMESGPSIVSPAKIPSLPPVPKMPVKLNPIELTDPKTGEIEKFDSVSGAKVSHEQFINSLKFLSNEPILLKAHINKYARSMISKDLETSITLFNISKSI